MPIQTQQYPEWAKIPENYDFSHTEEDLQKHSGKFSFRTDAVWEKHKLLDFFRAYFRVFRFDKNSQQYVVVQPSDPVINNYTVPMEDAELTPHLGFTKSGRTASFNIDYSKRDASVVSS